MRSRWLASTLLALSMILGGLAWSASAGGGGMAALGAYPDTLLALSGALALLGTGASALARRRLQHAPRRI